MLGRGAPGGSAGEREPGVVRPSLKPHGQKPELVNVGDKVIFTLGFLKMIFFFQEEGSEQEQGLDGEAGAGNQAACRAGGVGTGSGNSPEAQSQGPNKPPVQSRVLTGEAGRGEVVSPLVSVSMCLHCTGQTGRKLENGEHEMHKSDLEAEELHCAARWGTEGRGEQGAAGMQRREPKTGPSNPVGWTRSCWPCPLPGTSDGAE